jgi:DNA primase
MSFTGEEEQGEAPKYINSPETPVFSKGKLLYGLHQAKGAILEQRRVMVLEGYMDVIGAHQGGFSIGVATLGTALTRDHTKLLKRYADEIMTFFDADEAGRKAAMRGLEPILQEELFPRVVLTEEQGDPDEIIYEKGPTFFQALLDQAPDFVDYILKTSLAGGALNLQQKAALAKTLQQLIALSPNEILKSEWTKKVALQLGIDAASLKTPDAPKKAPIAPPHKAERGYIPTAEEEYLQLLANVPEMWTKETLVADDFEDDRHKRVMSLAIAQIAATGKVSVANLYNDVGDADRLWFMRLAMEEKEFSEPQDRRERLMRDIRLRKVKQRFSDLGRLLAAGQGSLEDKKEFNELLRQIKGKVQ